MMIDGAPLEIFMSPARLFPTRYVQYPIVCAPGGPTYSSVEFVVPHGQPWGSNMVNHVRRDGWREQ